MEPVYSFHFHDHSLYPSEASTPQRKLLWMEGEGQLIPGSMDKYSPNPVLRVILSQKIIEPLQLCTLDILQHPCCLSAGLSPGSVQTAGQRKQITLSVQSRKVLESREELTTWKKALKVLDRQQAALFSTSPALQARGPVSI